MHFSVCPIHCKVHWRVGGQEVRIVQIDFSAAYDRVDHPGILYKLGSVVLEVQRFCVVYTDKVSVKPITAHYGRWLLE